MEACSNSTAGYLRAHISIKGKHAHFRLHRVIWIAKYGSIPEGTVVCHKNNKKKDNRISNLYAATQKQNTQDAIRDGLIVPKGNFKRKFPPDVVEEIKKDYAKTNHAVKFLMNKYGISKTHLYRFVTMI